MLTWITCGTAKCPGICCIQSCRAQAFKHAIDTNVYSSNPELDPIRSSYGDVVYQASGSIAETLWSCCRQEKQNITTAAKTNDQITSYLITLVPTQTDHS